MTVGDAIREHRLKQGMTQLDLAIKINKSARMIKRYESGATVPSIKVLERIFENKSIQDIIYNSLRSV